MGNRASFAGTTALITGGASGIGLAIGTELTRLGAAVTLADVDGDALTAAIDRLDAMATGAATRTTGATGATGAVSAVELDVTDRDAFVRVVDELVDRVGGLDLLVNNAGISMGGPAHDMSGEHWDRSIEVNLGGTVNGIVAAYPRMVTAGRGQIVNTASAAALVPPPFVAPYAAAKSGVIGLSLGLRAEAALHGVAVNVLCPGPVDTPILDRLPPADLPATPSPPVTARAFLATVKQRPVAVESFARAAVKAIARNRAIIVLPRSVRPLWWMHRASPALTAPMMRFLARRVDRELVQQSDAAEQPPPR